MSNPTQNRSLIIWIYTLITGLYTVQRADESINILALKKRVLPLDKILFCLFNLKSMKFFLTLGLLLVAVTPTNPGCGDGLVLNWMNVCIQPEYIEGCDIYISQVECHQCLPGFDREAGTCHLIEGADVHIVYGCLVHEGGQCVNCANGFRVSDGSCARGVKNCGKYASDGTCEECRSGFSFIAGSCKRNLLLGCKSERPDHTCADCWEPFKLNQDHCSIDNCLLLNDYGCYACDCGFYLTREQDCKPFQPGCMRYSREECIDCLPHYQMKDGKCEIEGCLEYEFGECVQCERPMEVQDGGCQIPHCFSTTNRTCEICQDGYHLLDGTCVEAPIPACI